MAKEIKAYKAEDGKIFFDKEEAEIYERKNVAKNKLQSWLFSAMDYTEKQAEEIAAIVTNHWDEVKAMFEPTSEEEDEDDEE